ncbi:MAG: glycosyltransferase [Prevotella sp.]|jgi:GT2 family glycosyltransferase|nr:glycosyltransferase [Prevotella sp.]
MYTNKITIAIPVYERIAFFKEALNSAINQTIKCPIIVIDNASTHNKFKDIIVETELSNRITYIKNTENVGMTNNWNKCIEYCKTTYLTILHDDDTLHPSFIENILNTMETLSDSDSVCIASDVLVGNYPPDLIDLQQPISHIKKIKSHFFLFQNLSPFPGIVFPKDIAIKINGFNDSMYPVSDYDYWIRLSYIIPVYKTSKVLAYYRISEQQSTNKAFIDIIEKTYNKRKELFILQKSNKIIRFFSMYNLYNIYCFYCDTCKNQINFEKDFRNKELRSILESFHYRNSFFMKLLNKVFLYFYS